MVYDNFEISNTGILRNKTTGKEYKQCKIKTGYMTVCVSLGSRNNKKLFKIHKCVAEAFLPNPDNKPEVNHIDGDKTNNDINNLEWVTGSENVKHAFDIGIAHARKGEDNTTSKLTWNDVGFIRNCYKGYDKEFGARALGRRFNVCHSTIAAIVHKETWIN